jgi:PIN domain nuclease of toxin-antitoxin system
VNLLLDTHVVLWWLADDATLSDDIKAALDHEPDVYVSPGIVREVAIKQAIGKLKEPAGRPSGTRPRQRLPRTAHHLGARHRSRSVAADPPRSNE